MRQSKGGHSRRRILLHGRLLASSAVYSPMAAICRSAAITWRNAKRINMHLPIYRNAAWREIDQQFI